MTEPDREIAYADDLQAAKRNRLAELQAAASAWESGPMTDTMPAMITMLCLLIGQDDLRNRLNKAAKAGNTNDMKAALGASDPTADRMAKASAITAWIASIWLDYLQRGAAVDSATSVGGVLAVSTDFSNHGTMPFTFRDFLTDYVSATSGGVR
jgi:hypothetical protein